MYSSPFSNRYSCDIINQIFSDEYKYVIWRKLWVAVAAAQYHFNVLNVTKEKVEELSKYINNIDIKVANEIEKSTKHDVVAHVKAFGLQAKNAADIIHLGLTSSDITDNSELIQIYDASRIINDKLLILINKMREFALKYKSMPIVGMTHLQVAQPTTVGKRACLWLQDILLDNSDLLKFIDNFAFKGMKGATGTQASFLMMLGSIEKVHEFEKLIAGSFGFKKIMAITGQTYSRKIDSKICKIISGIAESCSKFAIDIRLLSSRREIMEGFGLDQVGSSAMPYKRNPIDSEKVTSICRHIISTVTSVSNTAANQWLERSLDDSSGRRIYMPELFIGIGHVIDTCIKIIDNIYINEKVIQNNINKSIPFFIAEELMLSGNRQELHEKIRMLTMKALDEDVDLMNLLEQEFGKLPIPDIQKYIGMASYQVEKMLESI